MSKLFEAANYYIDKGVSVVPCKLQWETKDDGSRKCRKPAQVKWTNYQKARPTKMELMGWRGMLQDGPGHGIAIITGEISGLMVVDIDTEQSHEDLWPYLKDVAEKTVVVRTPGGGWHYYFRYRDGFGNRAKIDAERGAGLDIRAEGGYVLAPPSWYPDGKQYDFDRSEGRQVGAFMGPASVAAMPEELFQHILGLIESRGSGSSGRRGGGHGGARDGAGRTSKSDMFQQMMMTGSGLAEGNRVVSMVELAGYLVMKKIPPSDIEAILWMMNRSLGSSCLTDGEMEQEVLPAIMRFNGDRQEKAVERLNETLALVELESGERRIAEYYYDMHGKKDIRFPRVLEVRESFIEQEVQIDKKPRCVFDLWRESPMKRKYKGVLFDPSREPWEDDGFLNLWKGFPLKPVGGGVGGGGRKFGDGWDLFLHHIHEVIGMGKHGDWILQWMARIIQDPGGQRPGTVIVLRGEQGTGKGQFANIFGSLLGKFQYYYSVSRMEHLTGRFNADLKTALLLFIDEATWGGDKEASGILKNLVTEPTRRIEPKGLNAFHVDNYLSLIIASNNEWVVPAGVGERRFLLLDIPDTHRQDREYFGKMIEQMYGRKGESGDCGGLRCMMRDLLDMDVDFNTIAQIPKTAGTADQIIRGLGLEERFWHERLSKGSLVDAHEYWKTLVVAEKLYDQYEEFCDKLKIGQGRAGRVAFGMRLRKMCPGIDNVQRKKGSKVPYRCWAVPLLDRCRTAFAEYLKVTVTWEDYEEPENVSAEDRANDMPGHHKFVQDY